MYEENIKVCHFGQYNHPYTGSFTIATRIVSDDDGDIIVEYGVAFCSPKDQFVKKIGNEYAIQRLTNMEATGIFDYSGVAFAHQLNHVDVVFAVLSNIATNNIMPDWARPLVLDQLICFAEKALVDKPLAARTHSRGYW